MNRWPTSKTTRPCIELLYWAHAQDQSRCVTCIRILAGESSCEDTRREQEALYQGL